MRGTEINKSTLLHPTSLRIDHGERIGLVGASGSGKSTLGHALIDELRDQGASVAHVPQSPDEALDPLRSMAFQWREAERALSYAPDAAKQQHLFAMLRIEGGDLDEPTSALDPVVAANTMDLLDAVLNNNQTAMLLITHDLGLAARRVSRLMVMEAGRIAEDAPTVELLEKPTSDAAKSLASHRSWRAVS